ncbi:MAG TPA: hypothetical protein PKX82_03175, partial [Rhodoferax sp.]|nr:hypothetical protein [Rhodoferax sp.]
KFAAKFSSKWLSFQPESTGNIDWRALDDSFFEFPPSCPELIPCNPNDGMAELQVQVLKQWLAHRMI